MIRFIIVASALVALPLPAQARSRPYVPEPGDTSLRARCRSEASMIGHGGRGAAQFSDAMRQTRRDHFSKCLQAG